MGKHKRIESICGMKGRVIFSTSQFSGVGATLNRINSQSKTEAQDEKNEEIEKLLSTTEGLN